MISNYVNVVSGEIINWPRRAQVLRHRIEPNQTEWNENELQIA